MIFHMSEMTRCQGIAEIYRVLQPQGRLLVLDLALPSRPLPRASALMLFGGMLQHELRGLLPLMQAVGFSDVEIAPAEFRVLGLSILAFARGSARKILGDVGTLERANVGTRKDKHSCSRSKVFVFGVWPAWQAS
jgi:hypothetical protein